MREFSSYAPCLSRFRPPFSGVSLLAIEIEGTEDALRPYQNGSSRDRFPALGNYSSFRKEGQTYKEARKSVWKSAAIAPKLSSMAVE
jgi:hypothetical protein